MAVIIIIIVLIFATVIPSSVIFPQATASSSSTSSSLAPIVISKVDPWALMRGLEGEKACFADAAVNLLTYAWIELHNTTNKTLTTSGEFQIEVGPGINQSTMLQNLTLGPGGRCLLPIADAFSTRIGMGRGEGNGPQPGARGEGAAVSVAYHLMADSGLLISYRDSTPKSIA